MISGDRIPAEQTLLGVIDAQARKTVADARGDIATIVTGEVPRRSGRTAAALRPRISRTATGSAITVRAPRGTIHSGKATIAQVVRWVNRGTGVHRTGGGRAPVPIRATTPNGRLKVFGREYWSVQGQRPNPFMDRIKRTADPRVERAFTRAAVDAARAAERRIG